MFMPREILRDLLISPSVSAKLYLCRRVFTCHTVHTVSFGLDWIVFPVRGASGKLQTVKIHKDLLASQKIGATKFIHNLKVDISV